ncbi:MAG: hypothetical protein LBI01_03220 [Elusimicrobium sp.]|jgi:hypothetical protein|nr:hypothetical protein [Elusimicrobium sp.]
MFKKIIFLFLILFPAGAFAQVIVSGVTGESGFVAARAALYYKVNEDLTIIPMYAYYKNTDESPSVNRFGLRAEYQPGRIAWGAEGGFVPRSNGYMNYSAGADAKYYIIGRTRELIEMLYAGLGAEFVRHEQKPGYFSGYGDILSDYTLDETRASILAGVTIKPVLVKSAFSKSFFSQTPPAVNNIWIDTPYFVTVNSSFLDYFWNTYAVLPLDLFDLHGAYSVAKDYWAGNPYQSVSAGATVKIMGVAVTGNVEFRNLGTGQERTYYSLSGNLYF